MRKSFSVLISGPHITLMYMDSLTLIDLQRLAQCEQKPVTLSVNPSEMDQSASVVRHLIIPISLRLTQAASSRYNTRKKKSSIQFSDHFPVCVQPIRGLTIYFGTTTYGCLYWPCCTVLCHYNSMVEVT